MFWKKPKLDLPPEWLIVGLGNPGKEFNGTRHNVGFEVVEALSDRYRIKLDMSKHRARIGLGKIGDIGVCLVRPLTYMNLSGQSVAPLARDYGIAPDHVLIIADDLDLPVGKLRLRTDGSAGGHNGHRSIIQYLKTQAYPRIKIGIGKGAETSIEHVLSSFTPADKQRIQPAIDAAADICRAIIEEGISAAQEIVARHNKS
ncbi:MAG TPA: aminoacyl-tRNA hydrolase [Fimbriimonadaceae bacterium]|nr:aminoacyl-tRNA hydrolase [Fimbriimonadaceae bacterium]